MVSQLIDGNESPIQLSDFFTYALTSRNPGKIRYFTDRYIKPEDHWSCKRSPDILT